MITNPGSKTRVDEVADGIYRISTPVDVVPGGFSFNQYLVVDEEPLLFHTGPRRMFPLVREAVAGHDWAYSLLGLESRRSLRCAPGNAWLGSTGIRRKPLAWCADCGI